MSNWLQASLGDLTDAADDLRESRPLETRSVRFVAPSGRASQFATLPSAGAMAGGMAGAPGVAPGGLGIGRRPARGYPGQGAERRTRVRLDAPRAASARGIGPRLCWWSSPWDAIPATGDRESTHFEGAAHSEHCQRATRGNEPEVGHSKALETSTLWRLDFK